MLKIESIDPTVCFVREGRDLLQRIDVTIEAAEAAEEGCEIRFQAQKTGRVSQTVDRLQKGWTTCQVYVPDLRTPTSVEFSVWADGVFQDRCQMDWQPARHWRVHMVPIAHHDLGYTDTIEGVMEKYCGIYEDVLRFCEQTEDWPEEAKFRYTAEETWSIQHFLNRSPDSVVDKLGGYAREGRIEIPALYGNEISGLCGHEELIRLLYPSFRLKRRLGVPIKTGSITDVPGLSWGLPTVLAGAGVRHFFAGLPTYFRWKNEHVRPDIHTFWDEDAVVRSHGRPDAFYWEGPDGQSVLVYYQGAYGCWSPQSCEEVLDELPEMLAEMDRRGGRFRWCVSAATAAGTTPAPTW